MTPYWSRFAEFERSYDGVAWIEFCRNHAEIPVFAITLYLVFVFYVPGFLEHREALRLKHAFAAWNAALAIFSCIGTTRTAPYLYDAVTAKGLDYTLCTHPKRWFMDGPVGLWMALFIYSKIPELLDTCFLVLQKKRVLFLGWFHHTTVLLYCWHAFHNVIATGLWFATMNYAVHTVMYSYYFAMVFARTRRFAKTAAEASVHHLRANRADGRRLGGDRAERIPEGQGPDVSGGPRERQARAGHVRRVLRALHDAVLGQVRRRARNAARRRARGGGHRRARP